jgi:hypothetical protein
MASLNDIGMGIGDFALNLLEQESSNPVPVKNKPSMKGNVPDIENVQVSQEDVNNILAESFGVKTESKPQVNLQEERKRALKEEIKQKIDELKVLLNELTMGTTTVGSLGGPNFSGGKSCESHRPNKKSSRRRAKVRRKK